MKILPAVDMYDFLGLLSSPDHHSAPNGSQLAFNRGEYAKATVAAQCDLVAFIGTALVTVTVVRYVRSDVAERANLGRACSLWSGRVWLGGIGPVGSRGSYTGREARNRSRRPTPICSTAGRSCCTLRSTTRVYPSFSSCWSPCGVCRNCESSGNPYASHTHILGIHVPTPINFPYFRPMARSTGGSTWWPPLSTC
jgi:hypothetical protein